MRERDVENLRRTACCIVEGGMMPCIVACCDAWFTNTYLDLSCRDNNTIYIDNKN